MAKNTYFISFDSCDPYKCVPFRVEMWTRCNQSSLALQVRVTFKVWDKKGSSPANGLAGKYCGSTEITYLPLQSSKGRVGGPCQLQTGRYFFCIVKTLEIQWLTNPKLHKFFFFLLPFRGCCCWRRGEEILLLKGSFSSTVWFAFEFWYVWN